MRARTASAGASLALLAASGCAPDSLIVLVDLRTAPGIEVSVVQTDIELDGRSNLRSRRGFRPRGPWTGHRDRRFADSELAWRDSVEGETPARTLTARLSPVE